MEYPTDSDWGTWGIPARIHRFFSLHWTELFDPETPDTWQARTCNVQTIMRELIDAGTAGPGRTPTRAVVRSLLDETFAIVSRDSVLKRFYPFVAQYIDPWRGKDLGDRDVSDVRRMATVILGNLDQYWERGVELVSGLLRQADDKRKEDVYNATMNLGTAAVARGHSAGYVRQRMIDLVAIPSGRDFVTRVSEVLAELSEGERDFTCFFIPEGIRQSFKASLPDDVRFHRGHPKSVATEQAGAYFAQLGRDANHLSVIVRAVDPYAAHAAATKRLGEVFSGLSLFNVETRVGLKPRAALVEGGGRTTLVDPGGVGSHHLGSYESRRIKAETLFRVQKGLRPTDAAQLAAAVQYHRLAMLATSDEARLINLWIALEALCQGGGGSIIERVCTRIAPCVSVDNIRKTFVSLAQYVRFLWQRAGFEPFRDVFPHSSPDRLAPEHLVEVLLKPDRDPALDRLCELCSWHPLVLYRLYRARAKILSSPSSVASNLQYTCRNVEWQLKRIYRIRNAIVHRGEAPGLIPQLTQHLHSYLVKSIRSVLTEIDRQPAWGIRDALEHRRRLFDHVVAFFSKPPNGEVSAATVLDVARCLGPQAEPFAWTAAAE